MKNYASIFLIVLSYLPLQAQSDEFVKTIQNKIKSLEYYHNTIIEGKTLDDTFFLNLFKNTNVLIDYLLDTTAETESLRIRKYLETLKKEAGSGHLLETISLEVISSDSTKIWCQRTFRKNKIFEDYARKPKMFRIEFSQIQNDYKIARIRQVEDDDFDGIEDHEDKCRNNMGIRSKFENCNGCPDLNYDNVPDNCDTIKMKFKWFWPSFVGGVGLLGTLYYGINTSDINSGWEGYLNGNNQWDVEKKYIAANRKYREYQRNRNVGIGSMVVSGIWFWYNCRRYEKQRKVYLESKTYQETLLTPKKIHLEMLSSHNSIGIALKF